MWEGLQLRGFQMQSREPDCERNNPTSLGTSFMVCCSYKKAEAQRGGPTNWLPVAEPEWAQASRQPVQGSFLPSWLRREGSGNHSSLLCGLQKCLQNSDPPPSPRDVPPPHHTLLHTCTFPPAEELSLHRGALRFRGINFRSNWPRFEGQLLPLVTLTLQR